MPVLLREHEVGFGRVARRDQVYEVVPLAVTRMDRQWRYNLPEILVDLMTNELTASTPREKTALASVMAMLTQGLTPTNYAIFQSFLLYAEEFDQRQQIRTYNMSAALVLKSKHTGQCRLLVPGMEDKGPDVMKGDVVRLSYWDQWYGLVVDEVIANKIYFKYQHEFQSVAFPSNFKKSAVRCNVRFTVNQAPFRVMHRALGNLGYNFNVMRLFPSSAIEGKNKVGLANNDPVAVKGPIVYFNEDIARNAEQAQAIHHIVHGSSRPHPYILLGPPGTGKTVTVAEAIKQVWKNVAKSRIVVAAPSNTAADLLASKLVDVIPKEQILRMVASSREDIPVDEDIIDIVEYGKVRLHKLCRYRIVVVTLSMSGKLAAAGIQAGHFTHVFIDEAGQASEAASLVPLSGLLTSTGQIVLSGDHQQLRPVNKSDLAKKFGIDTSLMERLMNDGFYSKRITGKLNPNYFTKLLRNFRSRAELLSVPSKLFYDDELIAAAPMNGLLGVSRMPGIPKPGFPIVFHGIKGKHCTVKDSTSIFNAKEIAQVKNYLTRINQFDPDKTVGVLSPYKLQVRRIKKMLTKKQKKYVLVGSTEEFQGQERDVMILSTVRSSPGGLGFLDDPRRFNVAVTRAKALMIVIGDPHLLVKDENWRALLTYALKNGGYTHTDCRFTLADIRSK